MIMAAVDTDILNKGVCYDLIADFLAVVPTVPNDVGLLPFAKYVVRRRVRRLVTSRPVEQALALLEEVVSLAATLEATPEETSYAAELEFAAQREHVELDTGESLLSAMAIFRDIASLVTGDKRAIAALELVLSVRGEAARLEGRVISLEHLVRRLVGAGCAARVRAAVCREPNVDRSLTLCFSCSSPEVGAESWSEGLLSQINDLRRAAPRITCID